MMTPGLARRFLTIAFILEAIKSPSRIDACCPVSPPGKTVVNADQTVIIVWDPATKTEHFIRRATFKTDADDLGLIIPTPSAPDLEESGDEAFGFLAQLTAPDVISQPAGPHVGCGCSEQVSLPTSVTVLQERTVAGFHAVVLEADTAADLTNWLKDNAYAYSPEIEAWARPYVGAGWKFTALKIVKSPSEKDVQRVAASALRLRFKTDRPLFPYREPDSKRAVDALSVRSRLLRIYLLSDARYQGDLDGKAAWTGTTAWSNQCSMDNWTKIRTFLRLPHEALGVEPQSNATSQPTWRLTEFEDNWPYQIAPADLYFSRSPSQQKVKRPSDGQAISAGGYGDALSYALAIGAIVFVPRFFTRIRRGRL